MFTAKEMNEIATKVQKEKREKEIAFAKATAEIICNVAIADAARNGKFSTTYQITASVDKSVVCMTLVEAGYKVTAKGLNITINWAEY